MKLSVFPDECSDDESTQKDSADREHCHQYEYDPVSGKAAEGIQDPAVDRVHECTGKITDKGGHGHGGPGDLTGNGYFIHGGKINRAHTVDTGADAQCDRHAGSDSHALVRQE